MNKIIWKGIDSSLIDGLIICQLPPITKPQMQVIETHISGVDGTIIEETGYLSYQKQIAIALKGNYNIDEIISYFNGSGNVTFSNEEDKYYKAVIVDRIDYERLVRYKVATITFLVQPYKYSLIYGTLNVDTSGFNSYRVNNMGNVKSKPRIELNGSGLVEFILNGETLFTYTFPTGETQVIIDSEKEDAYLNTTLKNRSMNGKFPSFNVGANDISWTGNITSIKITDWSRWL